MSKQQRVKAQLALSVLGFSLTRSLPFKLMVTLKLARPIALFLFQSDRAPNDIKGYPGRVEEQGDLEIRALFNRLTTRSSMRANEYLLYLNLVWFKRGKEPDLCLKGL